MPSFCASRPACRGAPAAERHHRVPPDDLAPFDGVHPSRVRHVLVHHLDHPDRGPVAVESQSGADVAGQRRRRLLRIETDPSAREPHGVEPAEHEIGVGHGRALAAEPVARGSRLGSGAGGTDAEPVHLVDPRDRAAARSDFHHLDDRDSHRKAAPLQIPVSPGDLEGSRAVGRPVLDKADLRGGAAHVQRERFGQAAFACDVTGQNRSPGGTRLDEPDGVLRGVLDRRDAAARHHQVERAGHPACPQPVLQAQEIARDQRPDVGIGAGGREALEFPDFGADFARETDGGFRQLRRQHLANRLLVRGVGVGVDEPDRHGLDPRLPPLGRHFAHRPGVEWNEDPAPGRHALVDLPPERARHERVRLVHEDVVLLEPLLESHLQDVAKPPGGQECGPRALALDEGVGRKRGAVDQDGDVPGRGRALLQDEVKGLEDARLRCARRGQHLGGVPSRGRVEDDVGKGASDIGREPALAPHPSSTSEPWTPDGRTQRAVALGARST